MAEYQLAAGVEVHPDDDEAYSIVGIHPELDDAQLNESIEDRFGVVIDHPAGQSEVIFLDTKPKHALDGLVEFLKEHGHVVSMPFGNRVVRVVDEETVFDHHRAL